MMLNLSSMTPADRETLRAVIGPAFEEEERAAMTFQRLADAAREADRLTPEGPRNRAERRARGRV